jgi:hypothetical protein
MFIPFIYFTSPTVYLLGVNINPTVKDTKMGMKSKTFLMSGFRVLANCWVLKKNDGYGKTINAGNYIK